MVAPKFSERTRWSLEPNALSRLLGEVRGSGQRLLDLTESNPTRCGLLAPELIALLGDPRGASYDPAPLGEATARASIAAYCSEKASGAGAPEIVLSASTSEAYGWLFELLCDRGDAVLVPTPSYPLFEYLAALEDVRLVPYPLVREEAFRIDLDALAERISPEVRAILVVHPNNPTGTFTRRDEAEALEALADRHGLALIVDEVFADFAHRPLAADRLPTFAGRARAPTFVLGGLSKLVGLPQVKLGWMAISGPQAVVDEALGRLEVIADTYLSVGTPIQRALPEIMAARGRVQARILARVRENLAALDRAIAGRALSRLPADGGWSAILELPRTRDDDAWIELLVRQEQVLAQPGWFYDLPRDASLVVSLLPEPAIFVEAIERLVAAVDRS